MSQRLYFVILAAALAAALAAPRLPTARAQATTCPAARTAQMDECASQMGFLGDHSFKVPRNSSAMGAFCQRLKRSISCLQEYTRDCLRGFPRQIMTSLLKRGKQQYQFICQEEPNRRDFQRKLACLTDDKIDQFHACMDASVARFEFIAGPRVAHEAKLPGLCCSYQIFNRELDITVDRICTPAAAAAAAATPTAAASTSPAAQPARRQSGGASSANATQEFIHKVVGGTAGEFFGLICSEHRSMDECRASTKTRRVHEQLEQVTRQVAQGKLKPRNKSLVPVLLEILSDAAAA